MGHNKIAKSYKQFLKQSFPKSGQGVFNVIFDMLTNIDGFFAGLISSYLKGQVKITAVKWQTDYIQDIDEMLALLNKSDARKLDEALFLRYQNYLEIMKELADLFYEELQKVPS